MLAQLDGASVPELAGFLRETAYVCATCEHVFEEGDTVYRRKLGGFDSTPVLAYCAECVTRWEPRWWAHGLDPQPCVGGCGVLVSSWTTRNGSPVLTACSSYCARQARNARRRKAKPTTCPVCGNTFTPTRATTVYCSPAHRQKSYRQRHGQK